jgi:hypothetical protein
VALLVKRMQFVIIGQGLMESMESVGVNLSLARFREDKIANLILETVSVSLMCPLGNKELETGFGPGPVLPVGINHEGHPAYRR